MGEDKPGPGELRGRRIKRGGIIQEVIEKVEEEVEEDLTEDLDKQAEIRTWEQLAQEISLRMELKVQIQDSPSDGDGLAKVSMGVLIKSIYHQVKLRLIYSLSHSRFLRYTVIFVILLLGLISLSGISSYLRPKRTGLDMENPLDAKLKSKYPGEHGKQVLDEVNYDSESTLSEAISVAELWLEKASSTASAGKRFRELAAENKQASRAFEWMRRILDEIASKRRRIFTVTSHAMEARFRKT